MKGDDSKKSAVVPAGGAPFSNKGKKRAGSREEKPKKKKKKTTGTFIRTEPEAEVEDDDEADPSSTEPGPADTEASDTVPNPNHIELKTNEQVAWEAKEAKRSGARQALARQQRKSLAVEAVKGGSAVPRGICMAYWARDGCKMVKGRCPRNFKHLEGYRGVGIPAHLRKSACSGNPCKFGAAKCLFRHEDEPATDGDLESPCPPKKKKKCKAAAS